MLSQPFSKGRSGRNALFFSYAIANTLLYCSIYDTIYSYIMYTTLLDSITVYLGAVLAVKQ